MRESTGNCLFPDGRELVKLNYNGSSETTCNNSSKSKSKSKAADKENIKPISDHLPKNRKLLNDNDLGYYLAGLIDGDGHFNKLCHLIIAFNIKDISLAYNIKSQIGYGSVRKIKNKNAVIYVISNYLGLLKILNLINGKIKLKHNQIQENILINDKYKNIQFYNDDLSNLDNYWLSGFTDADGSFQVKIISRLNRTKKEVRLNYQVDQKDNKILNAIKNYLGGNIGYRISQDTYYYGSTSFGSARNVIKYFDKYHLQSTKYINYIKWRKVYRLIQNNKHLTTEGFINILKIKTSMSISVTPLELNRLEKEE